MHHLKLYLSLMRFDKPIGRILLAWPCLWGIAHAYHNSDAPFSACIAYAALLTVGAFLMSGFGCIINDMTDKNIDKQVERTKTRPLAAGMLSSKQAIYCAALLALGASIIFLIIPTTAKLYACIGAVLVFVYPFMKRITYYPQVILGTAFNTGILVGYACLAGQPKLSTWYLYLCGVFWTIAYDTIYAFQDIVDDEKVGVKSTAIRFKEHPKLMVGLCYFLGGLFLIVSKGHVGLSVALYSTFALYTLILWNPNETQSCSKFFKLHALSSVFALG